MFLFVLDVSKKGGDYFEKNINRLICTVCSGRCPNAEFEEYINDASELISLDLAEYLADSTGIPLSDVIASPEYSAELEKIRLAWQKIYLVVSENM